MPYAFHDTLAVACALIAVGLLAFLGSRKAGRLTFGRVSAICFAAALLIRFPLFDSSFAWRIYRKTLSVDDVDFRREGEMALRMRLHSESEPARVLAFGSSQVYHLFAGAPRLTLPGAGPLDLVAYSSVLDTLASETLILHLSEFDMAREPAWSNLSTSPLDWATAWTLRKRLVSAVRDAARATKPWPTSDPLSSAVEAKLLTDLFPERKYSFLFRAYRNRWLDTESAKPPSTWSDDDWLREHLSRLATSLSGDWIQVNVELVRLFLERTAVPNIVIVEGQYNPLAYSDHNRTLNALVRTQLKQLACLHDDVTFVPRPALMPLDPSHYRDGYHVRPEAAVAYQDRLARILRDPPAEACNRGPAR